MNKPQSDPGHHQSHEHCGLFKKRRPNRPSQNRDEFYWRAAWGANGSLGHATDRTFFFRQSKFKQGVTEFTGLFGNLIKVSRVAQQHRSQALDDEVLNLLGLLCTCFENNRTHMPWLHHLPAPLWKCFGSNEEGPNCP